MPRTVMVGGGRVEGLEAIPIANSKATTTWNKKFIIYTELMQENPAKRGMKVQSETCIFVIPVNTKSDAAAIKLQQPIAAALMSRDG
jgi:hypothetical protein